MIKGALSILPLWSALEPVSHKGSEEKDLGSPMQEDNPLTTSEQSQLLFLFHSAISKAIHLSSENFKCELENYQAADRVDWVRLAVSGLS